MQLFKIHFFLYALLALFISTPSYAFIESEWGVIQTPVENETVVGTVLNIKAYNKKNLPPNAQWILFRSNNGQWPKVYVGPSIKMNASASSFYLQDVTPVVHFCADTYAIRLMDGATNLLGPVHFKAGTGACAGDTNNFVNLEYFLSDVWNLKASDQADRDTCGAFAGTSALEAAYTKYKAYRTELSQHYLQHVNKTTWLNETPFHKYENQTSYWGGNNVENILKMLKNYPIPRLLYSPYQTKKSQKVDLTNLGIVNFEWVPNPALSTVTQDQIDTFEYTEKNISTSARRYATFGILDYGYNSNTNQVRDPNYLEGLLKQGFPLIASVDLFWKESTTLPKTYEYNAANNRGSHLVLIVGFDKTNASAPYFLVKNSWKDGIIRVSYAAMKNTLFQVGWIKSVRDQQIQDSSLWIGQWKMQHDQWRGVLNIRRTKEVNLNRLTGFIRLGDYRGGDGIPRCVWGEFSPTAQKLTMVIDFDSAIEVRKRSIKWDPNSPAVIADSRDICGTEPRGQRFELTTGLSYSNTDISGKTWWNNIEFPARIWR